MGGGKVNVQSQGTSPQAEAKEQDDEDEDSTGSASGSNAEAHRLGPQGDNCLRGEHRGVDQRLGPQRHLEERGGRHDG